MRLWTRAVQALLPDLPGYEAGGGPVIPQAVVIRGPAGQREVLLVKRTTPRAWELPGGYLNAGEDPQVGMAREVWEETGLRVRSERLVGWYERTGFRPHRSPVYACTEAGGQLRRSREAVAVGFFPVERLPLSLFPWYREIIRDAVEGRSHSGPREQHLGLGTVVTSAAIHLGAVTGLLRP
ncbi:MAG TPA: NUDIX domain-containing protein [Chloroflexota bacterium]|jgi:ADP-ribose pyrophosphatase YjhB (NUDIX family)|nr:NUDIX domain-containing protein [Chloroflexota bacterium]